MARKRELKDAAQDPLAARETLEVTETRESPEQGHQTLTIVAAFLAGLAGGLISSRLLRLWFLKM